MSDYPSVPDNVRKNIDNILFIFDFDGTLVQQTKFVDNVTNIVQFMGFKLAVNPSAFNIKWTIVTSRPIQDFPLIEDCLRRNNASITYPVMAQNLKVPEVGNQEELNFKIKCINYCKNKYSKNIIYVDNNSDLCEKITQTDPTILCINIVDFLVMCRYRIMECGE